MSVISVQQHPTLWHTDGNIVISAAHTSTISKTLFCLHRSILGRNSEVFRDMTIVAFSTGGARYNNLPLVELYDQAEDLASLFEIMYDPTALYRRFVSPLRADIPIDVLPLLALVEKYVADTITQTICAHISSMWPHTLAEWTIRRLELDTTTQSVHNTHPEPGAAIALALKHREARALLPAAFYQLSITREEVDWSSERLARVGVPVVPPLAARWALLDADTMRRFTRGRRALLSHYFERIQAKFQKSRVGRQLQPAAAVEWCKCDFAQLRVWVDLARRGRRYDCLKGLRELIEWPENLPGLCNGCSEKNRLHFKSLQQELWDMVPPSGKTSPTNWG